MGLNYRKRVLLEETQFMKCKACNKIFPADCSFCPTCGEKLTKQKTKIFANMGKNGITSLSCKLADGTTINSKGNMTIPLANGLSYTTKKV